MPAGPLRTIRIVWFGAEEVGLFGGLDYRAKHGKEPHHAIAESDFGAGRIWKVDSKLGEAREAEAKALADGAGAARHRHRLVRPRPTARTSARCSPTACPGVGLNQDGTHYFDLHHTPDDTLDKVDPDAAAAECRGVDGDARGPVGRDRGAETPRAGVDALEPQEI